jgi:hypothetical protein
VAPPAKNCGAPHSSTTAWAAAWAMMPWYGWHNAASASALAAVPLKTKKTSQSVSKTSRRSAVARAVSPSSP